MRSRKLSKWLLILIIVGNLAMIQPSFCQSMQANMFAVWKHDEKTMYVGETYLLELTLQGSDGLPLAGETIIMTTSNDRQNSLPTQQEDTNSMGVIEFEIIFTEDGAWVIQLEWVGNNDYSKLSYGVNSIVEKNPSTSTTWIPGFPNASILTGILTVYVFTSLSRGHRKTYS